MRRPLIVANWKMYKTHTEALSWLHTFSSHYSPLDVSVVLAPAFTALESVSRFLNASPLLSTAVHLGAQTLSAHTEGAFTGEISPLMLKALEVSYVILGHSERRQLCHETSTNLSQKVVTALHHGLKPILCIGEDASTHAQGKTLTFLTQQINDSLAGLENLSADRLCELSIAYEPIWAIGTGIAANPETIQATHSAIRDHLLTRLGPIAQRIPLLYGGSLKASNARAILSQSAVDGALVGGASLDPMEFLNILQAAPKA